MNQDIHLHRIGSCDPFVVSPQGSFQEKKMGRKKGNRVIDKTPAQQITYKKAFEVWVEFCRINEGKLHEMTFRDRQIFLTDKISDDDIMRNKSPSQIDAEIKRMVNHPKNRGYLYD